MYSLRVFIAFCVICPACLSRGQMCAQTLAFAINEPVAISYDRNGFGYVADTKGNVDKIDSTGRLLLRYTPRRLAEVTLVEAWLTVRIGIFYRDWQHFTLLDRFLNPIAEYDLQGKDFLGFVQMATLAADNQLWLFDQASFSLKKYNPQLGLVSVNTALDLLLNPNDYEIIFLKEYQNQVFLVDKNTGVLLFDQLGNYRHTIAYKEIQSIALMDDTLLILLPKALVQIQLYDTSSQILPLNEQYDFVMPLGTRLCVMKAGKVSWLR